MDTSVFDKKIVIIKDETKKSFINLLSGKLINTKVITLSEFKKKYFFDYNNETIFYICNKYNVIPEIATIYLNNLYYIKENVDDEKNKFLLNLKHELDDNNLLIYNILFRNFIQNSELIIYDCEDIDEFYINTFNRLNVRFLNLEGNISKKYLYKASNMEEEVSFVASSICKLIKKGIDINKIKLCNVTSEYLFDINRIFKLYNIPVEISPIETIQGMLLVKKFKELYSNNIEEALDKLYEYVFTEEDMTYFKKIVNIVNSFNFCNDYNDVKDMIFNKVNKIKKVTKHLSNSVKCIDFKDDIINDNEYVFFINFNEGVIPTDYKDEDYLSDKVKKELGISTSYDLNQKERYYLKKKISLTKNLTLSYREHNGEEKLYVSSLYDEKLFINKKIELDFNDSNNYNKIMLVNEKDLNNKYGSVSEYLCRLNSHYKDEEYLTYNNKFKGIDKNKLYEYLGNKLKLSYTSIDSFYGCSFKYYLKYILGLDKYENNFDSVLGTIFHNILAECFTESYDLDSAWEREISKSKYEFTSSDKFFLKGLKNELSLTIDTIKEQLKYTSLNKFLYEKNITIDINDRLNVKLTGFIDKIMYKEDNNEMIIAVIDYKTGSPYIKLDNVKYGFNMQLPIYVYLIKNSNEFRNAKIGGFYLQHILDDVLDRDSRIDSLKLQGYSNNDRDILKCVDNSYEDSKFIRSLKLNGDGSFYYHSKLISDEEIGELNDLVDEKVHNASEDIINAKFNINPKKLNNEIEGCKYCKFKSICYMKNEDIVTLGGEKNGLN